MFNQEFARSQFASNLRCPHCNQVQSADYWAVNGDSIVFCIETSPKTYNLEITCPNCSKKWFVVWDNDPGLIKPLWKGAASISEMRRRAQGG